MLYAFAIEPDVLATWDRCRITLNLMGFQHGRAIAAYPSWTRWRKMILKAGAAYPNCGEREFTRIHEKILDSECKVVRISDASDYDESGLPSEEAWIRNATRFQDREETFHAILSTRNPGDHPDVVLEEDVDESHPKLNVPREAPVLREASALTGHIETLVQNSREMLLIDPHFDPSEDRWRPVVRACIQLAAHTARDAPRVAIHTLDADKKPSLEEFERRCRPHIRDMLSGNVSSIRICRWRLRDGAPDDFHARYVLTDRGGYRLDKGLDEEPGVEQSVELLSNQTWKRLREGYSDTNPLFDKDGEFTVTLRSPAVRGRRR